MQAKICAKSFKGLYLSSFICLTLKFFLDSLLQLQVEYDDIAQHTCR